MATHGCINCPKCHRGCSLCGRCACPPAEPEKFSLSPTEFWEAAQAAKHDSFGICSDPELEAVFIGMEEDEPEEDQKPETD